MMNKLNENSENANSELLAHNDEFQEQSQSAAFIHDAMARTGKSISAFKTISEVSEELKVPQHVLRFWETKFSQVRPLKRGGGRRYYRPEDVQLLHAIHNLLYSEGYTIKGVQKLLRDMGKKKVVDGIEIVPAAKHVEPAVPVTVEQEAPKAVSYTQETMSYMKANTANEEKIVPAPEVRTGLTSTQRDALDGILDDLKQIRNLIQK